MKNIDRDDVLIGIGLRIKILRKERGLTQKELAYSCNLEKSNLSRIEHGKCNMTIGTLLRLCSVLEVELIDVVNV